MARKNKTKKIAFCTSVIGIAGLIVIFIFKVLPYINFFAEMRVWNNSLPALLFEREGRKHSKGGNDGISNVADMPRQTNMSSLEIILMRLLDNRHSHSHIAISHRMRGHPCPLPLSRTLFVRVGDDPDYRTD